MKIVSFLLITIFIFSDPIAGQKPYELYTENKIFGENSFVKKAQNISEPPSFDAVKGELPIPFWKNHDDAIACYWKAWEIAFRNLKTVTPQNGFVSPYIDAAFNGNIFMWDASFMTMFGRYGSRAFNFQGTLDNFYRKQKPDGFICREIYGSDGSDCFERFEPSSTGPNIMPWAEWEYFLNFNDINRLNEIFPPLLAYYRWFRINRTWKDGSYYSSGWGCGMDNQPRLQNGYDVQWGNGHMSWIDTNLQQILSAKILVRMAEKLDRQDEVQDLQTEIISLTDFVNQQMWNGDISFYTDLYKDGIPSTTQSIGAYWALLADIIPESRFEKFIAQLSDTSKFDRPHRVPSLAADDPHYDKNGGYWRGSVWLPTTYMVLRGLTYTNQDSLAYEIATNNYRNVLQVFKDTDTFFENYAPEKAQGNDRSDFIGWTGLTPIAVLFEYIFGIRSDVFNNTLIWDVKLTDEFGVNQYPFGLDGLIDLRCKARKDRTRRPEISVKSNVDFDLILKWDGRISKIKVSAQ